MHNTIANHFCGFLPKVIHLPASWRGESAENVSHWMMPPSVPPAVLYIRPWRGTFELMMRSLRQWLGPRRSVPRGQKLVPATGKGQMPRAERIQIHERMHLLTRQLCTQARNSRVHARYGTTRNDRNDNNSIMWKTRQYSDSPRQDGEVVSTSLSRFSMDNIHCIFSRPRKYFKPR